MRVVPFVSKRKPKWSVEDNLDRIKDLISEDDPFHFCVGVKDLYPMLQKRDVSMPEIEPVISGVLEYDLTWHVYHLDFLKLLLREIKNNTFDHERWNNQIRINDHHRHQTLAKQRKNAPLGVAERGKE